MSHYIHGSDPEEQRRLTRLNALLNAGSLRELGLGGGERIVDFGAGLGQLTRAMARQAGRAVLGIERSHEQIAAALAAAREAGEAHLLELREGDVREPPLREDEWERFDVAHARFVLEHVPDPLRVVQSMVRSVRQGGRVVLTDDDHSLLRLWPEPAGFRPLWDAYQRCYDRIGNDPIVGRRLVQLLHQAGARARRTTWLFFGSCAGGPDFGDFLANLVHILEQVREPVFALGFPARDVDAALDALRAWGERPDAAFWYGVAWAEGVRG